MGKILKNNSMLALALPDIQKPRRLAGEVFDAAQRARNILSEAEADARRIRLDAEDDRESARIAATEAGRQEGLAQVAHLMARAAAERDRILMEAERELVQLALAIARTVLGREVLRDTPVVEMAGSALERVRRAPVVVLRVHPEEIEALRAGEQRLAAMLSCAPGISIREDPTVTRGGVVVETEGGSIDARIETQLAALEKALEEVIPR